MSFDKKKAAALAAVMQYLQSEREYMEQNAEEKQVIVAVPDRSLLSGVQPWGYSGRSAQMQSRVMMQLKAFRG